MNVGNQRDGRQSRDRHGHDGQCRGCKAPGAGERGARPRVVGPRPAGHMEAWGEHEAIPGQTSPAEQPPREQPPREQGPHGTTRGPVNRPQGAEPRGAEPRGAGNTPRTSLSERMKHFISAPLPKPMAGVCQRYVHASPRRAINPISVEGACTGSHDLDTCGRNAVSISSPHLASPHNFETKMRALAHYLSKTVNYRKLINLARS